MNGASVGQVPRSIIQFDYGIAYAGVIASHGTDGNSQFALLSFGLNDCGRMLRLTSLHDLS